MSLRHTWPTSRISTALQVAVECALDVGNMLISLRQWRSPESNRDVFVVLAEHAVVEPPLMERLSKLASFRNILVQEYTKVDPGVVFALLRQAPPDLRELRDRVIGTLKQPGAALHPPTRSP